MKGTERRRVARSTSTTPAAYDLAAGRPADARARSATAPRATLVERRREVLADPLSRALGSTAAAVTLFDREWRIVFINQRGADLLGASPDALAGRNLWEMYPAAAVGRGYQELGRAMRDRVSVVFEQPSPDGGRSLQCLSLPVPEGLLVVTHDVDEPAAPAADQPHARLAPAVQPKVAAALQRSDRRFRALIENSRDAVLMVDRRGRVLYASPRVFGADGLVPPCTALGPALIAELHPDDVARARADWARLLAGQGQTVSASYRIRQRDSAFLCIEGTAHDLLHDPAVRAIVINCRDVTEKRRSEEDLRFSEQHFRSLIEGALDLVTVVDDGGKVLYASPSHERVLGWQPANLVGRSVLELVHVEDRARLTSDFEGAITGRAVSRLAESRIRHKDGSWRVIESIIHRSPDAAPVAGFIVNARDVTERRLAEQKTATLLELARDLESAPGDELHDRVGSRIAAALPCELVAAWHWDEAGGRYLLTAHRGLSADWVTRMSEIPPATGRAFLERLAAGPVVFTEPASESGLLGKVSRLLGVTSLVAAPLGTATRRQGALLAATTRAGHCFGDSHAELMSAIATQLAVVLERSELDKQRQEDSQLFAALARIGQDLLSELDASDLHGRLCRVAAEALGCATAHTLAWLPDEQTYAVVATHGTAPDAMEALRVVRIPRAVLDGLLGPGAEDVAQVAGGGSSPGAGLASILGVSPGKTLLAVALRRGSELIGVQTAVKSERASDFAPTQLKIASGLAHLGSLALEHARAMAELSRANRLKSDFVAMISHELRTPLNVILGYSDLLLDDTFGALQPAQAEPLRAIHARGQELLQLIRDVLDLSRLESGRMPLDLKEVSLRELLLEIEAGARMLERRGEVELQVELEDGVDTMLTDPAKLAVALKNLLANAFKFTPRGVVRLAARRDEQGTTFTVTDTGIGIAPGQLDIIFEPFRQGDATLTRRHGGVGLGLYIVRRMVELLGGTVQVESRPGTGSTFRIALPRGGGAAASARGAIAPCTRIATTDAVTGLPSPAVFRDRLAAALRSSEPRHVAGVVLYVAVDCSETLAAGLSDHRRDALLCMVGERLASVLRMTDTVARHGGDDFVVLLQGRSTEHTVAELTRRVAATLSVDLLVDGLPRRVAATIGAVVVRGGRANPDAIVARARRAAAQARQSGRTTTIRRA